MEPHNYSIKLDWKNNRNGVLHAQDLNEKLTVATPPPFPKGEAGTWSPEHLLTAAVSSCLMTTFLAIAENSNLQFIAFSCDAEGTLDKVEGKLKMSKILVKPVVRITYEKDRDRAMRILQKAEAACLITNSITAEVIMEATIEVD